MESLLKVSKAWQMGGTGSGRTPPQKKTWVCVLVRSMSQIHVHIHANPQHLYLQRLEFEPPMQARKEHWNLRYQTNPLLQKGGMSQVSRLKILLSTSQGGKGKIYGARDYLIAPFRPNSTTAWIGNTLQPIGNRLSVLKGFGSR